MQQPSEVERAYRTIDATLPRGRQRSARRRRVCACARPQALACRTQDRQRRGSDPAVVAAKAAHRSAILELQKFCRENGLDLFGAPRREGSGAYGQFQIIQIPRRERGL